MNISVNLSYKAEEAGTVVLNIRPVNVIGENLTTAPLIQTIDQNRLLAVPIAAPGDVGISYSAIANNPYNLIDFSSLLPTPISLLSAADLHYLNPSRYCHSDMLSKMAFNLFGHIDHEFEKVMAIANWVNANIEYVSGSTNEHTTALDTILQQSGVCRDFAHVAIAFCRALNIPARYCSVYALELQPPDFHACFEALLSGYWVVFDATRLAPLNGFIKIAVGADAADTAVSNIFGKIAGQGMEVRVEGVLDERVYYNANELKGICYV